MPRWITFLAAALVSLGGLQRGSRAEDLHVSLPEDVKFAVRLDLPAIREAPVAGALFAKAKDALLRELADKDGGKGVSLEKIVEVLGFDPFEEIQSVVVAAADYESPENSLVACIQLRKTSGNLEGLMLALPGYSEEEYEGLSIYSATPDDGRRAYCSIYVDASGNRTVLLAAQRDALVRMLDSLAGRNASAAPGKELTPGGVGISLAVIDVYELPPEVVEEEGPPANVAKILKSVAVRIGEADGKVHIWASVLAEAEKQAEQLEQMAKGSKAMVDLAASSDPDDEDLQQIQKMLVDLAIERKGSTLELSLGVPADDVQKFIDENLFDK